MFARDEPDDEGSKTVLHKPKNKSKLGVHVGKDEATMRSPGSADPRRKIEREIKIRASKKLKRRKVQAETTPNDTMVIGERGQVVQNEKKAIEGQPPYLHMMAEYPSKKQFEKQFSELRVAKDSDYLQFKDRTDTEFADFKSPAIMH
jgi:hypothetical protein